MKDVCAYTDQFSVASQQNIFNHFPLSCEKPITQCCNSDTFSEKNKWENIASVSIKKWKVQNMRNWRNH